MGNSSSGDGSRSQDEPRHRPPTGVLDGLLEGLQVISPDYRYLYVNDAIVKQGRKTRQELIGRTMMEAYRGIEDTKMFSLLRRCMQRRTSARMENQFTFPDGSSGWFELRFEPVPDGVAILSIDITSRKHAEAALLRTLRTLTTLSQCNQALLRADDERQLMHEVCRKIVDIGTHPMAWIGLANLEAEHPIKPAACAGRGPAEQDVLSAMPQSPAFVAVARRALDNGRAEIIRIANDASSSEAWHREALERGFRSCIVLPIRARDRALGALTIFAAERDAFRNDELALLEEVALDLGYGIDTLRTRVAHAEAFRELEVAQARTRAIYDHLPHATFVWRRVERRFTLADFNKAAVAATDGGASRAVGSAPSSGATGVPHVESDLARCADGNETIQRELDCVLPGGDTPRRYVLTYGSVPPDAVLLHAQDVTDQRRTEEQLVAAQRLEAVGRLAGGVAHDFNNLLVVILGYASLALERVPESDPLHGDINEVHQAGERAAELTRQLLVFSRGQVIEPRVTNLNRVVGDNEKMLRRVLGEDIDLQAKTASDLGNVVADPGQLEQVVMNLAVNARDAMPDGGKLLIETSNAELDEEYAAGHLETAPGRYVLLSVTDTGAGMSAETRDHIFEPFFTTKETGKGTGLGLSMIYGIVKQSGGSIWVYSELGQGTTFKIYLPCADADATEDPPARTGVAATGTETILLVEDDDTVRRVAERILRGAGYAVLTASGGAEALRTSEEHGAPIDLLVTDMVMPEMSGRELADRLKRSRPAIKVLFTSGYTDNAIVHRSMLEPGTNFLSKPFSIADLTRNVRGVLDDA